MSTKHATDGIAEIAVLMDRLMRRIHAGLHLRAVAVDTERVGPVGGMVLFTLAEIEPAPLQRLGQMVARDKSQMTRLINMLEAKALVQSAPSATDSRMRLVSLTPAGHDLVARLRDVLVEVVDETLENLVPKDRAGLHALLAKAVPPER